MIFGTEDSRPFETRVKFSGTIYLQGPIVSTISRNERCETVEIMLFYNIIRFQAHHQYCGSI